MNIEEVLERFRFEGRTLVWPGETLEALPLITRRAWTSGQGAYVIAHALTAENADETIAKQLAHFGAREFEWKVFSFDNPPDLLARLAAAGFEIGESEALVFYDLKAGLPLATNVDCEVRRIEHIDQLEDFKFTAERVFGKDYTPTTTQLREAILAGDKSHVGYVGYVDGEPATVGRLYTQPQSQFAGLYGGGTRPEFRGRGCYRAMIAARAADALAEGARYLQVDAMPTSRPILVRLGFEHLADTWPCTLNAR